MREIIPANPRRTTPDTYIDDLVRKVGEDRWLPILRPPFDPRGASTTGTLQAILSPTQCLLGRLAVTMHAVYEQTGEPGFELLKASRSKDKVQYAIETKEPGFYYLVFFQGKRGKKQLCQRAKFVSHAPESCLEEAKKSFLTHQGDGTENIDSSQRFAEYYSPRFEFGFFKNSFTRYPLSHDEYIGGTNSTTTIDFNPSGRITKISCLLQNIPTEHARRREDTRRILLNFASECAPEISIYGFYDVDNTLSCYPDQTARLDRDGVFRVNRGPEMKVDLAADILKILEQLPIENHIIKATE